MTGPDADERFRIAARAYFVYGVVYWIGGVWLALNGVGVRAGSSVAWRGIAWIVIGLLFVLLIPFLLRRRRAAFERWVLSRRDFARVLSVLMGIRAIEVARVALRAETPSVPAPWGGTMSFQAGAIVFLVVTVAALIVVARAAWTEPVA